MSPKVSSVITKSHVERKGKSSLDFISSVDTNCESMVYRTFSCLHSKFEARGVRKVTTGITGLWQPSVHSDIAFDPSMSALPNIAQQIPPSVGSFTR